MSDESRIIQLNNGLTPRQKRTVGQQNVTVAEVDKAFKSERAENEKMVKWYMDQVPAFVAGLVAQILAANGIEMKGPENAEAVGRIDHDVAADTDTPGDVESATRPDSPEPIA